jgi:serine/threonine protein phosphatase Stp1
MIGFRVITAGISDKGLVRSANEDSLLMRDDAGLWAVADGMGGHSNGQWASQQVVGALAQVPMAGGFDTNVAAIADALQAVNLRICTTAQQGGLQIGSTVVTLLLQDERFAVLWTGDSRIYLCRGGRLVQLTIDHTYVQDLVAAGSLRPEDAKSHPSAHVLSRAVGVTEQLKLDAITDSVMSQDVFLLCSDGLSGLVTDAEIEERLAQFAPASAARRLVELTMSRGATDNVTVVVVRCEDVTNLAFGVPHV